MMALAVRVENPRLERLKIYLLEWAAWTRDHRPRLGVPGSTLGRFMKSTSPSASEILERSNAWAMMLVEAAIDDLMGLQDGVLMRAALRSRYLQEGLSKEGSDMKVRLIKRGEIVEYSAMDCDRLADRAELALVAFVIRRGLPI